MLNHKAKVKLARKLRTNEEWGMGIGMFKSAGWLQRKFGIMQRVHLKEVRANYRKELKQGLR